MSESENFTHTAQYQEVMSQMWNHPHNDQRPAVMNWLHTLPHTYDSIVDIGPGDGYYLEFLKAKKYTVFEPNVSFHDDITEKCRRLGIESKIFSDIDLLLESSELKQADLVLMIHVLFYMEIDQVKKLLIAIQKKPIVMVNPLASKAITIQFEQLAGSDRSAQRTRIKEQILGEPSRRETADTHFRLPLETRIDSLAYLISQLLLDGSDDEKFLSLAKSLITDNESNWKKEDYWELPQAQLMETYNSN
jgi:hypothetical protein